MITENSTFANNCCLSEFFGLSTDVKPTNVRNASTFYEMDTKKVFLFDEESKSWLEQ